MRPPEQFITPRLRLRPVVVADAEDIYRSYAGEVAPTHFMNFKRHEDIAESQAFARYCQDCWVSGEAFPWVVTDKGSGVLMGIIELRLHPPKADFGYVFAERFWGRGYASEAASTVVDWTFSQSEIYRVWATCHPDNLGSAAVLRKAGLSYEATLANWEARPQLGEVAGPSHVYALVKSTP